jgi:glycine/D-amino acid oxidase-like deaminating enzyme
LPSFERRASCLLALEPGEADELRASAAMLAEDGLDAELVERGADAAWSNARPIAGLVNPGDAVIDPAELMGLLAGRLRRAPMEGAEVFAIERTGGGVVARTPDARVAADRCLVCLNGFTPPLLRACDGWIAPNRGQMLALEAPGVRLDHAYYANHGGEYIRRADERLVIVGGWRRAFEAEERTASDAVSDGVQAGIEAFAERVLGGRFPVAARWAGTMGFSATGLPIVAPAAGEPPGDARVWVCGGFTGHGMSLGHAVAGVAAGGGRGRHPGGVVRSLRGARGRHGRRRVGGAGRRLSGRACRGWGLAGPGRGARLPGCSGCSAAW